jgi:hypothetical protein
MEMDMFFLVGCLTGMLALMIAGLIIGMDKTPGLRTVSRSMSNGNDGVPLPLIVQTLASLVYKTVPDGWNTKTHQEQIAILKTKICLYVTTYTEIELLRIQTLLAML